MQSSKGQKHRATLVPTNSPSRPSFLTSLSFSASLSLRVFRASLAELSQNYCIRVPVLIKAIDCFLLFHVLAGLFQILYAAATGARPYGSFLGGLATNVGGFVLAANLRLQVGQTKKIGEIAEDSKLSRNVRLSNARALAEYIFATLLMNLFIAYLFGRE